MQVLFQEESAPGTEKRRFAKDIRSKMKQSAIYESHLSGKFVRDWLSKIPPGRNDIRGRDYH